MNKEPPVIKPDKLYSLREILVEEIFQVNSYQSVLRRVIKDFLLPPKERILKAQKMGDGGATRYYIKGQNLIQYLKKYGAKNKVVVE